MRGSLYHINSSIANWRHSGERKPADHLHLSDSWQQMSFVWCWQSCICTSLLLCIHFRSCSVSLPTEIYLADTCDTLAFASVAPIQGSRRVLRFAVKLCMRIPTKKVPIMFQKEIPTEIHVIHHQTIQPYLRRARTASVPIQSRGSPTWEVILDASDLSAGRDYRVCVDQDCWNKTGTSWKLESLRSRMYVCMSVCVCVL